MAYATAADLEEYLGSAPADSTRLLDRASELIDHATLNRIVATDAVHVAAALKATCAQVEYWTQAGEETDILAAKGGMSIGSLRVDHLPEQLAPRARRALLLAGLLFRGVEQVLPNRWRT